MVSTSEQGSIGASSASPQMGSPADAARAQLVTIKPQTLMTLEPGREFHLDTSGSFERPAQARISYTAELSDGRPLPTWLMIDASTGMLSGAAPTGALGNLDVTVTARTEDGAVATAQVIFHVGGGE
jgi:hypothetical protein